MDKDGQDRGEQGPGEQDGGVAPANAKAKRVRTNWRQRRAAAGLVEVMAWVREDDLIRAITLLEPLTEAGDRQLRRHERQGRANLVGVTVRFPQTPPHAFREEVLKEEWQLSWDKADKCWRGGVENKPMANELRRMVARHGGVVEMEAG